MRTIKSVSGRGTRRPQTVCPFPLLTRALTGIVHAVVGQLHPSKLRDIVRDVGAAQGRLAASEWQLTAGLTRRHDIRSCVQCLRAVAQQCGWSLRVAIKSESACTVTITESRFTEPRESGSYLCELTAGLFAGVMAETLGCARVYVGQCPETPPLNGVFTIELQESEKDGMTADIVAPHVGKEWGLPGEKLLEGRLYECLTPRELQVLRLIAQGLSDRKVAATLHLSVRTVENHGARIREKLRVDSRTGLVRFAFRARLVE